ncbi:MAG: RNA-binding cell elongation regulator Jag/EloR [Acidimicrobiales bacterium]
MTVTAKTVPEAIDLALDNLGVDEAEAEIEVLEEPKQGLFGRTRGTARVKARVKPRSSRPKVERNRNRKGKGEGRKASPAGDGGSAKRDSDNEAPAEKPAAASASENGAGGRSGGGRTKERSGRNRKVRGTDVRANEEASMDEVSAHLSTFLSGLTEAFGYDDGARVVEEDEGLVAVVNGQHGLMVGPRGRTLDAIQELARVSAQRSVPSNIRIKVDVGGYRELRREALARLAVETAEAAKVDGKDRLLEPMNSADRKVVHDALNEVADVETRSAGEEPYRRVVIVPVGDGDETADEADEVEDDTLSDGTEADDAGSDDADGTAVDDTAVDDTADDTVAEDAVAEDAVADDAVADDAGSDDGDVEESDDVAVGG